MGNVIEFLARVGREASLRHARGDGYDRALEGAGFDPPTAEVLRARDGATLRALLGQRAYFETQMGEEPPPDNVEVPPSREEEPGHEPSTDDPAPAESPQ
ncbi:hypothetical protein KR767_18520 [Luteibacter anthropi]|uniref:Uncharacterized protein n=1 Tax=Luteibacter anthropi TaxID=564369 RepID=A0A7X5U8E9_9GAMM|nr:hypothetical protein [Luteibacter anthropi]NII05805.1 hypothetical protein [Luteibacter anthropi]URX62017.1 hypothetical protein KR767_18520 [Luteibacter anthropi]